MPVNSPTTGNSFYSGDWERNIRPLIKALNIDAGKMNSIDMLSILRQQEQTDRYIDNELQALYIVPFVKYKIFNHSSNAFVLTYPGKIAEAARYHCAGLILKTEFQQVESNTNEEVQSYLDYALTILQEIRAFTYRLEGQQVKPDISLFLPPTAMPLTRPEPPTFT